MANGPCATCPFTVLVDSAEQHPWTFQGLKADADKGDLPLVVPYEWANLGRGKDSLGDYSIAGLVGHVAVERKSLEDCISTVLGWTTNYQIERGINGRRERFKRELQNLAAIPSGIVVVEAPLERIVRVMPGCDGEAYFDQTTGEINATRGVKSVRENRKIFFRSVVSWQERYRVNWFFCDSRRAAEVFAFRYLEKAWEHYMERLDKRERQQFKRGIGA